MSGLGESIASTMRVLFVLGTIFFIIMVIGAFFLGGKLL